MLGDLAVYAGLFAVAFLAASIFPAQSEAVLLALVATKAYSLPLLFGAASLGNVLGAVLNWWLGTQIDRFQHKNWFPVKPQGLAKARAYYTRYGRWVLLLSWVPIIGDPLTVVAGVMREKLWIFLLLVGIAKTARYAVLLSLF